MDGLNTYAQTAPHYDRIRAHFSNTEREIAFYRNCTRAAGDEALELACGTGRIAIALAQTGARVWALDWSGPMLGVFRRKLEALGPGIPGRIRLIRADMAAFALGRRFKLILLPFGSFNALVDSERRTACLHCVREHLAPGGLFILDALCGPPIRSDAVDAAETARTIPPEGDGPAPVMTQTVRHLRVDAARQAVYPEMAVRVVEADGRESVYRDRFALARLQAEGVRAQLRDSGFDSIEDRAAFAGPRRQSGRGGSRLFLCRTGVP